MSNLHAPVARRHAGWTPALRLMRSLSANLTTQAAAEQSGWAELLDIYLKETLTTPFGSSNVIRISNNGVDVSFFKPLADPEPAATRGDAATYNAWAFKRKTIKSSSKFANDKLGLAVSNVTAEFADLLDDIDFRGCAVVIRKTALSITTPTSSDSVTLFSGRIDSARVDLQQVQLICSSDMATFTDKLPKEDMHVNCRFSWADDLCTDVRFAAANFQPKTCAANSTTTRLLATYAGYAAQAVTADAGTDKITLAAHTLSNGHRVRFGGTTVPGGITAGRWYYVVSAATNDFKVSLTYGGSAVDLTSAGTSVTITSEKGFTEDTGTKPWVAEPVTVTAATDLVALTSHSLLANDRVRFAATTMPGGLTAGVWYYVVPSSNNDFQVSATEDGAAIDITSAGSGVTVDSSAPYGGDEVDALATTAVDASSEQTGYEGYKVRAQDGTGWRFSDTPSNPTPTVDLRAPHVSFDFGGAGHALKFWKFTPDTTGADWHAPRQATIFWSDDALTYVAVLVATLAITRDNTYQPLTLNTAAHRYWRVQFKKVDGAAFLGSVIGKIKAYDNFGGSGTDRVDALSDAVPSTVCVGSNEVAGNEAVYVQASLSGTWECNADAVTAEDLDRYDWGNNLQGYWQIPDAQAGLNNYLLKPYLTFDFGSAKSLKLWRVKNLASVERQDIVRVLQFHSSPNADMSGATHELNFEIPPTPGAWTDIHIHNASSAQYWRICVRSTWAEALNFKMMAEVRAYTLGRNWWHNGRVTFASDTTTAALRGVSRRVLGSWSGAVDIVALPATPAAGDRFNIERGCGRTFNECCVRRNEENFGGFTTLPGETVLR